MTYEQTEIWRFPVDGSEPRKLDVNADHIAGGFLVSPDGRHVAFVMTNGTAGPTKPGKQELWMLENFLPTLTASK